MKYRIPFNRSSLVGREMEYISATVEAGQIAGDQSFSKKCHSLLEELLSVPKAFVTTSCTHALEMCALLLEVREGDEVIVPSFTFVSTINAFVLRGARPVFCDIRSDTLNLDEKKLKVLITARTKVIVVVHYAGVACEMEAIMQIANKHGVAVVEDNAHGLFGKYKGRWLGTFGTLATQSFHETKNITCGEGGALLINDAVYIDQAEIIREKGTNRTRFFRGEVDKYTWVGVGSSYVMSDVLAAFLYGQLEEWQKVQACRRRIWETYNRELQAWAKENEIQLPTVPGECEQAYHMFYMLLASLDSRQAFIEHLRKNGIYAVFHYLPLNRSVMGKRLAGNAGSCPVSENISDRLVRLPFYNTLDGRDQEHVISKIREFQP